MKKCLFFFLILIFLYFTEEKAHSFSKNFIEINLIENKIGLVDFYFLGAKINGEFFFTLEKEKNNFIFCLDGKYIFGQERNISPLKIKLEKRGVNLYFKELSFHLMDIKGEINLDKNNGSFDVIGAWKHKSNLLEGKINIKTKVWGTLNNFFTSGNVLLEDGKYKGRKFSKFRLDFLGKPPLLNITDSEIYLTDGSIFLISGVLDLRDFTNILPGAKFVTQKAFLGEWKIFSEDDKNAGLEKNIDENINVRLNTDERQTDVIEAGAELRYNMEDDNYLKLRMQENKTIIGFERRKDF